MRYPSAIFTVIALLLFLPALTPRTSVAAITVNSTVSTVDGVQPQAIISNPTSLQPPSLFSGPGGGEGGGGQTAVAIKEITASILIRDDNITNGIAVTKRQLTRFQTYGQGDPQGHEGPPITDPEGPWFGLVWPYRDQYDYFPTPNQPLGDDVGNPFEDQPGVYGFVNIAGISRGGPTDPSGGNESPEYLKRGITGNGLDGPASYFKFDIVPLLGPFDRFVRIQIFAASAIVVQRDDTTGAYSEIRVDIPDFVTLYQLPEPSMALLAMCVIPFLTRRAAFRMARHRRQPTHHAQ